MCKYYISDSILAPGNVEGVQSIFLSYSRTKFIYISSGLKLQGFASSLA